MKRDDYFSALHITNTEQKGDRKKSVLMHPQLEKLCLNVHASEHKSTVS
jgi:hypothetical protein